MKKLNWLLCLIFIFAGCKQGSENNSVSSTMQKIQSTKELHVGYFIFEPTIMEDPQSKALKGIFIDMIKEIGKELDAKVIYHKVDLANFSAGLQSQQFDISIGATFATPQRARAVSFTNGIFYSGYTGVVKKDNSTSFKVWQDFDKKGLVVAVKQGSAIDDFVRENFKNATILRLTGADLTLPLAAVSAGQADVGLMNQLTVYTYLHEHSELKEILSSNPIAPTYFSWAVRPNDTELLNYLNVCIEYYLNTGKLFKWESEYGIPLMHPKTEYLYSNQITPEFWTLKK